MHVIGVKRVRVGALSPTGNQVSFWLTVNSPESISDLDIAARDYLMDNLQVDEVEVESYTLQILEAD